MSHRFRLDGDEAGRWFVQELVCHDDEWVTRCTCTSRETALEIVNRNNGNGAEQELDALKVQFEAVRRDIHVALELLGQARFVALSYRFGDAPESVRALLSNVVPFIDQALKALKDKP